MITEHQDDHECILDDTLLPGYGLETARHFHAQGWNVVATMRTPREDVLPSYGRCLQYRYAKGVRRTEAGVRVR